MITPADIEYISVLKGRLDAASAVAKRNAMVHVDYLANKAGMSSDALLGGQSINVSAQVMSDARANIDAVLRGAHARKAPEMAVSVAEIVAAAERDLEGWCTREKSSFITSLIASEQPEVCVEIGVYGGRSLVPAAAALKCNGAGFIYGVETWRPEVAVEHRTNEENDEWWASVDFHSIKTRFLKFIADFDLASVVRVIEAPSADVASLFLRIDYLHIDGAHSVYNAAEDAVLYGKKVNVGGVIIMDDADWPTTKPAIAILDSFCERIIELKNPQGEVNCVAFRRS